MSPKQPRGDATKRRVLEAALAVYASGGHGGFTVQAVAATSGTSVGSIYHHFGSFDGVAAALYVACMDRLLADLACALARSRTARTGVAAFVRAYLAFAERSADEARFIHGAPYGGFIASHAGAIAEAKAARLGPVLEWVRARVEDGELADLPPALFEMLVVGPVAEVTRRWLAGAPEIDLGVAARVLPERIWRAVAKSA